MPLSSVSDTASMQSLLGEGAATKEDNTGKEEEEEGAEEKKGKASKADISKSISSMAAAEKCVCVCVCVCSML